MYANCIPVLDLFLLSSGLGEVRKLGGLPDFERTLLLVEVAIYQPPRLVETAPADLLEGDPIQ